MIEVNEDKTDLDTLMDEWSEDWQTKLGKRADGAMVWGCNAHDIMLLVWEIQRLRGCISVYEERYGDTMFPVPE